MTDEKIVLVSRSQGERGSEGRQKKYIIYLGGNSVVFRWGKAELHESWYQRKVVDFDTEIQARAFAIEQMYKKMDKGYERIS
jgi:predicted DNA-binding WGR domain protein